MSTVYLSHLASPRLQEYLLSRGHTLRLLDDDPRFGRGTEAHPDLRMCRLGPSGPVIFGGVPESPLYPACAAMCAAVLDGFLIHRLDITDPAVLQYCRERRFTEINVRQGFAKCSCVIVGPRSLITSDPGIFRALSNFPELDVLKVREGHVALPGFDHGFLGGASGLVGGELVFNGDLSAHPDFHLIEDFVISRGAGLKYFPGEPLSDTGSIIEDPGDSNT